MHSIEFRYRFMWVGSWFIIIGLLFFLLFFVATTYGDTTKNHSKKVSQTSKDQNQENLGIFDLSMTDLMNIEYKVDVASLFYEDELMVESTVSSVTPAEWKQAGARKTHEALDNQIGVVNYRGIGGSNILSIRGYANNTSNRGISWLIDGIPLNTLSYSTAAYTVPDWSLHTLDKIEMIKGPGSSIYGSDAFHGVVSLKSFESDKDSYSAEVAGAYPGYYDAGLKLSQGLSNTSRIDIAAGAGHQGALDIDYDYEDLTGSSTIHGLGSKQGTGTREYKYDSFTGMAKLKVEPTKKIKLWLGGYTSLCDADNHPLTRTVYMHMRENDLLSNESGFFMGKLGGSYAFDNQINVEVDTYTWETRYESTVNYSYEQYNGAFESGFPAFAIMESEDLQNDRRTGVKIVIKQPDNEINLRWALGYSYTKMEVMKAVSKIKAYPSGEWGPNLFQPFPDGRYAMDGLHRDINSMFLQTKWEAVENRLYLIAGARNDYYSDFGNQFTPRAGIILKPCEKSSIKTLYSQAFRAPSGSHLTSVSLFIKGSKDMDPEIIDVYELIYMYKDENWKLSLNSFYSQLKDGIIQVDNPVYTPGSPTGSPESFRFIYVNEGKSRSYGAEASLLYKFDPFGINLGLSYTKSEALDINDPIDDTKIINQEYDVFPEYSLKFAFLYFWKKQNIRFQLNNILYLGMKEYPSTYKTTLRSPDDLSPFWRVDLNINKNISEKIDLILDIRNLINRTNSMPSMRGMKDGLEEPGISVLVRAGYRF